MRLNREWLVDFVLDEIDEAFFRDPAREVIARGGEIFCAVAGDTLVGCCSATPKGAGEMTLSKVAVAPAAQGRGIGRRLTEAAIAFARAQGSTRLVLWSNHRLEPALRLYERLGFEHRPFPVAPPHVDADIYMEFDVG